MSPSVADDWQLVRAVPHTYQGATRGGWSGMLHTADLPNLPRGATFEYRVGDCGAVQGESRTAGLYWSEVHSFRTPPASTPAHERASRGGRGVSRIAVFGDMGVSAMARRVVSSLTQEVQGSGNDGGLDAVLHLGDFGYNLPDPLARNWDITEDWYIQHKQR